MSTMFGVPASPFVRKAMLAHTYKEVPFELQMINPGSEDNEFRKASPLGKIPAYKTDAGTVFSDSSVIIAYIEKTNTKKPLYPENAETLARALWFEEYADSKLAEACNALYFQLIVGPKFFNHTTDERRVLEIKEVLIPNTLAYIESQLSMGEWIVDNLFSVADISIGAFLINLYHAQYDIESTTYPKLSNYYDRFLRLDFVRAQLTLERGMLFES